MAQASFLDAQRVNLLRLHCPDLHSDVMLPADEPTGCLHAHHLARAGTAISALPAA